MRSDAEIVAHLDDVALLHAVGAGEVVRGRGRDTAIAAPHLWHGVGVRTDLRRLMRDDLIEMPISGPPRLTARGRHVLQVANGEVAPRPAAAEA